MREEKILNIFHFLIYNIDLDTRYDRIGTSKNRIFSKCFKLNSGFSGWAFYNSKLKK